MSGQRLDKWLWCARLVRTRSGAARLIAAGKVRINGDRALKSSRLVHTGDVVTAIAVGRLSVFRVLGTADRRGPASSARGLYEDLTPQVAPPDPDAKAASHRGPRPTKRDRRRLDALRNEDCGI
jgi:ribosome-associated heat shock protein Hsp15